MSYIHQFGVGRIKDALAAGTSKTRLISMRKSTFAECRRSVRSSGNGSVCSVRPTTRTLLMRPSKRHGTVLLVVAVVVMLMSLAAYQFMLAMQTEHMAAAISGDRIQAQQAAYSARDLLVMMLESSREKREAMGGLTDNPLYFGGNPMALTVGLDGATSGMSASAIFSGESFDSNALSEGSSGSLSGTPGLVESPPFGTIAYSLAPKLDSSVVGGAIRQSSFGSSASQFGANDFTASVATTNSFEQTTALGTLGPPTRYGAKNESARLHLLKLLEWETNNEGDGVSALMKLPGMDDATAQSILDWLDEDDDPRTGGAESEFYSRLMRPVMPRNGLPPDLDELLFVQGVSAWRLFGIQTEDPRLALSTGIQLQTSVGSSAAGIGAGSSFSGETSGNMLGQSSGSYDAMSPPKPWCEYLTVYSAERNETFTGKRRLFINSKDLQELHQELSRITTKEFADFLILYRQFGIEESQSKSSNAQTETETVDSVTINFETAPEFDIEHPLDLIGVSVTVPAEDNENDPIVLPSPFGMDPSEISPEFVGLLDKITLNPDPRIIGRINVNEAAPEVLLAIPGMTETIVEAIMTDRKDKQAIGVGSGGSESFGSSDESQRRHPLWLLLEGMVDLPTMRKIWSHVTCGGDVYRAEVWGHVDDRSPTVRFETVLDASTKNCRPVYYRELSAPRDLIQIKAPAEVIAAAEAERTNDAGFGERGI